MGHVSCAAALVVLQRDYPGYYKPQASLVDEVGLGGTGTTTTAAATAMNAATAASSSSSSAAAVVPPSREQLMAATSLLQLRAMREADAFRRRTADVLVMQDYWQDEAAKLAREFEAIAKSVPAVRVAGVLRLALLQLVVALLQLVVALLRCCVVALLRCCIVALLRCCVVALLNCCVVLHCYVVALCCIVLRCCVVALLRVALLRCGRCGCLRWSP